MNVNESPESKPQCGMPFAMPRLAAVIALAITVVLLTITVIVNVRNDASAPATEQPVTFARSAFTTTDLPSKASLAKARTEVVTRSIVRKPIATPKPKPTVKPTPKPVAKPAPAPVKKKAAQPPAPKPVQQPIRAGVGKPGYGWGLGGTNHPFLLCVAHHESWDWPAWDGNYGDTVWDAENPTSTASGPFQMLDGTFINYARMIGVRYSHASDAPPAVQARVALKAISMGHFSHWNGTHCGYGT